MMKSYLSFLPQPFLSKPFLEGKNPSLLKGNLYQNHIAEQLKQLNLKPKVGVFQIGSRPESNLYVRNKENFLKKIGGTLQVFQYPEAIANEDLKIELKKIIDQEGHHGYLLQLPIPTHLTTQECINLIPPEKDLDGLHSQNQTHLLEKKCPFFLPCTPLGILLFLQSLYSSLEGLDVAILGRSQLVGRPLAFLLLHENVSLHWFHSKTRKKSFENLKQMDVIITATGKDSLSPYLPFFSPKSTIIDVGIWLDENQKLRGDLKDHSQIPCQVITPVPGGVGPLTVAALGINACRASWVQSR